MNENISAAQFTHTEFGSTKTMYRSPKQPYTTKVQNVVHNVRGVGTEFTSKGSLQKNASSNPLRQTQKTVGPSKNKLVFS